MPISLGELATRFGCELIGDPDTAVSGVASLGSAGPASLTFLSSAAYASQLPHTKAAAVILRADDVDRCPVASLIAKDPYSTYAHMAAAIHPNAPIEPGIHESAVVAESANVASSAYLGPNVVIGERTRIGERVSIGPGSIIGDDCEIGDDTRFIANVTFVKKVKAGARGIFHPGLVVGSDGFGNAMTPDGWVKVPQLGGVQIGDDVEIGSNCTIDCGAIGDTVIEDGVRIDNLCQIAHNCHIGAHTAMASCCAIAGSTIIGKRCMFSGFVGSAGHITVCDDVIALGRATLSKDITEPGTYGAAFTAEPAKDWAKKVARFRRIDKLIDRVKKLEEK